MSNLIRVLHVLAQRPSGGIGSFLYNMHSNIDTSKVQFDYLICDENAQGEFDNRVKSLGGRVYVLSPLRNRKLFVYIYELCNFFKKYKEYNIVHGHLANAASIYFFIAKRYGINHRIIHSHNTKYSDYKLNSIRNYFLQLPLKKVANRFFACSLKAADFLYGKKHVEQNKVEIIQNAIDAKRFRFDNCIRNNVKRELGLEDKFVLGHVGAFVPQKNHSFLIDIFNEVYKQNPNTVLLLIGTGILEQEIKEKVKSLGLDDAVFFLGRRIDVNKLMQGFDIFLLPSLYEGLPLVGIEAQAAGLKCLISDTVTEEIKITDLVDFISLSSLSEWTKTILKYENNYNRKDTYEEIVNAGYDVAHAAEKLQNFYLNLK